MVLFPGTSKSFIKPSLSPLYVHGSLVSMHKTDCAICRRVHDMRHIGGTSLGICVICEFESFVFPTILNNL